MAYFIHHTARRHGISDDDIDHAIRFRQLQQEYDDGARILYLGPDRASNMLEVLTIREDDDELVIHAMKMQSKYDHLLTEDDENDD